LTLDKDAMAEAPRTPIRTTLEPGAGGDEENIRRTPGGLSMEIVLTPALRSAPLSKSMSLPSSPCPLTPRDLKEKLCSAEARRVELNKLRKINIDERLASVQTKKEELIFEKSNRVKEELENKLKVSEENRELIINKTKEDVHAYLTKVEQKVKDLEVSNEAEKIAIKIAMDANTNKADEKRSEQLEQRIKELQDHDEYVKQVKATQEMKKKQYLANLELSLDKASKRKEEQLAKVVEAAKETEVKVAEAKERRDQEEKVLQEKTLASLNEKLGKVEEKQAFKDGELKAKIEEKNRKAELVKNMKNMNLGPESA